MPDGEDGIKMPMTRYRGSKRRIVDWIINALDDLEFNTALDIMGGTATVAYALKKKGKKVTYNDYLLWNYHNGVALIRNDNTKLSDDDVDFIFTPHDDVEYDDLVERVFDDVYFTNDENKLIDVLAQNIPLLKQENKISMAYFCLCQVLIMKRPYNLFHRKNLYMRTDDVERSFGNKATWEKPILEAFNEVRAELNSAIFSNGQPCESIHRDCFEDLGEYDLVYIDSPYLNSKGEGADYRGFYHFLDGICDYGNWEKSIDFESKHRRLKPTPDLWSKPSKMLGNFYRLFSAHKNSIIVVSYRSDGIPLIADIKRQLERVKSNVRVFYRDGVQYALSPDKHNSEVLIIGTD